MRFLNLPLLAVIFTFSLVFALGTGFLVGQRQKTDQTTTGVTPTPSVTLTPVPKSALTPIRVEPPHNQDGVSTSPQLVIYFNGSTSGRKVEVKVTPSFQFNGEFDANGTVLTINPTTALAPKTLYTVGVEVEGIPVYSWSFTTGEQALTNNEVGALAKFKAGLPYRANHFWIDYKATLDTFYIYVDAKPVTTYQNQALAYFRSQGISDNSKLKIEIVPIGAAANP